MQLDETLEKYLEVESLKDFPIPIFKEGKRLCSDHLGIEFLPTLKFDKKRILKWTLKACKKALKKELIVKEQRWLGSFYDDEISNQILPNLSIRWIDDDMGFGVFADANLKKNTYIGEYTGKLRRRKKWADQKNSYTFEYLIGESIDTAYTIDAKDQGNHTRFINHSISGNSDPMLVFHDHLMKVIVYTNRDVKIGEQISYNYGPDYWAKREGPQSI